MKSGVAEIVGRQVAGIIVATNKRSPEQQLFLTFSDGTYFEIWGSNFNCSGGVDQKGPQAAINYITQNGGTITAAYGNAANLT